MRASWEQAAQAFSEGESQIINGGWMRMAVVPMGDDAAYTVGTERGQAKIGEERYASIGG